MPLFIPPAVEDLPRHALVTTLAWCMAVLLVFFVVQLVTTLWLADRLLPAASDVDWTMRLLTAGDNGTVIAASVMLTLPIMAAVLAACCQLRGVNVLSGLGLHDSPRRRAFDWRLWLKFIAMLLVFNVVLEWIAHWLDCQPMAFMDDLVASAQPFWWLVVAMVVAAPLYEELMFRGFMWTGLARSAVRGNALGAWGASILTSVIFALIHLQYGAVEMLGIFALGMLFAAARWWSGALYLPIALHMVNNSLAMAQYVFGYA